MSPTFKLMGGLGNQLFIYTAALYYANLWGRQVAIDPQFVAGTPRGGRHHVLTSSLHNLNIDPLVAISPGWTNGKNAVLDILADVSLKLSSYDDGLFFTHNDCGGFGNTVSPRSVYVRGYFQSSFFLESLKRKRGWASPTPKRLSSEAKNLASRISAEDGVALHVRRGDYKNQANAFGELNLSYYERALEEIEQRQGELKKVFIFSDEPSYVEEVLIPKLKRLKRMEVVKPLTSSDQDLYAMSHASSFVLANSSFSWWAASLNSDNRNVTAIYPKPWFRKSVFSESLFPKSWIPVDADWLGN